MPEKKEFKSKSSVVSSPYFATIMDSYDKFGRSMSNQAFWKQYVVPIDPSIIYMTWIRFARSITKVVKTEQEIVLDKFIEKKKNENEMEKSSLQNILAISEATIDTLVENPNLLAQIPVKERMKWLFSAMKARDSRMVALIKVNAEKRKTTMYEDMIQAAQYGEISEDDFSTPGQVEEQSIHEEPKPTQIPSENKQKIVDFDPDEI